MAPAISANAMAPAISPNRKNARQSSFRSTTAEKPPVTPRRPFSRRRTATTHRPSNGPPMYHASCEWSMPLSVAGLEVPHLPGVLLAALGDELHPHPERPLLHPREVEVARVEALGRQEELVVRVALEGAVLGALQVDLHADHR